MVSIGIILKSPSDVGFIKAAENAIKIALNAVLKGTYLTNYSISNFNIKDLFGGISTAMIVIGVIILCLSFFGCCGGCFRVHKMLIIVSEHFLLIFAVTYESLKYFNALDTVYERYQFRHIYIFCIQMFTILLNSYRRCMLAISTRSYF